MSSWPVLAAASAGGSGSIATSPTSDPTAASEIATRSTYRMLLIRGLKPDEAANLTAFLCGIPVARQAWTLTEVNQLLFLRSLARTGRLDESDAADRSVA